MTHYLRLLFSFFLAYGLILDSYACVGGKGFFPKNNWRIPVDQKARSGITEIQFNDIIDKAERLYSPIIRSKGGRLSVQRLWSDGTVNAFASRQGSTWLVQMYGGLARHGEITPDGFALVLCHEIGHHIGGAPRYSNNGNTWASNEGQSDYFAATKCLRRLWSDENNEDIVSRMGIPSELATKCEEEWGNSADQALCKRISMAGLSTSRMFAVLTGGRMPAFDTPDPTQVVNTLDSHPPYQCRLDTYFHGGLCTVDYNEDLGQNNPNIGSCNRANGEETGSRRLCWYKPRSGGTTPPPTGDISPTPTMNGQTSVSSNNPNVPVQLSIDLSSIPGAVAVVLEASKPNTSFTNPNGTGPDPVNSLGYILINGTRGVYNILPARQLPGWGTYQFRVLALDRNRQVVSKFSNPFVLNLNR